MNSMMTVYSSMVTARTFLASTTEKNGGPRDLNAWLPALGTHTSRDSGLRSIVNVKMMLVDESCHVVVFKRLFDDSRFSEILPSTCTLLVNRTILLGLSYSILIYHLISKTTNIPLYATTNYAKPPITGSKAAHTPYAKPPITHVRRIHKSAQRLARPQAAESLTKGIP